MKWYPISDTGAIYIPNLIVFRASETNGYALLEQPQLLSFIACPAIRNPEIVYSKEHGSYLMVDDAVQLMKEKMRTIFNIAVLHGHDSLVLSALGCGAFKCPPKHVAMLFKELLEIEYADRFDMVAFGIFDDHNSRRMHNPEGNVKPFIDVFGCEGGGKGYDKHNKE